MFKCVEVYIGSQAQNFILSTRRQLLAGSCHMSLDLCEFKRVCPPQHSLVIKKNNLFFLF